MCVLCASAQAEGGLLADGINTFRPAPSEQHRRRLFFLLFRLLIIVYLLAAFPRRRQLYNATTLHFSHPTLVEMISKIFEQPRGKKNLFKKRPGPTTSDRLRSKLFLEEPSQQREEKNLFSDAVGSSQPFSIKKRLSCRCRAIESGVIVLVPKEKWLTRIKLKGGETSMTQLEITASFAISSCRVRHTGRRLAIQQRSSWRPGACVEF